MKFRVVLVCLVLVLTMFPTSPTNAKSLNVVREKREASAVMVDSPPYGREKREQEQCIQHITNSYGQTYIAEMTLYRQKRGAQRPYGNGGMPGIM